MFIAQVVIIGILLVFLILVILTLILAAFPGIVNGKKAKKIKKVPETEQSAREKIVTNMQSNSTDDYALISVITAAIAAYRAENGESSDLNTFKVVAFRKKSLRR